MTKNIVTTLYDLFNTTSFTLKEAYEACPTMKPPSVRARIYENIGVKFKKIDRGVYQTLIGEDTTILVEGNGRQLNTLKNNSIDLILTDHPWSDPKSNKGGNRDFTKYDTFRYTLNDFKQKYDVLKEGAFLVEMLPSENANNYEYLHHIKTLAKDAGFEYYAKVPWKKGNFIANTGRSSKNTEDVMIFSKGKARKLKPNTKKIKATGETHHKMSGASQMLPTIFDFEPPSKKQRLHQSEKPVALCETLINLLTLPNEIVLDQFAGSGVVLEAATNINRRAIGFEIYTPFINKIKNRFQKLHRNIMILTETFVNKLLYKEHIVYD